jgi:hypothetical protein
MLAIEGYPFAELGGDDLRMRVYLTFGSYFNQR